MDDRQEIAFTPAGERTSLQSVPEDGEESGAPPGSPTTRLNIGASSAKTMHMRESGVMDGRGACQPSVLSAGRLVTNVLSPGGAGISPSVTVLVAGDLCWDRLRGVRRGSDLRLSPWASMASEIEAHDLAIVNLECPLTTRPSPIAKSGPNLSADTSFARVMRSGGFDLACLANNHVFDMGARGLADTIQACREAGLATVGAGRNLAAAVEPFVREVRGVRIGILAFAEEEFSIATPMTPGAAPLDAIENARSILAIRSNVDVLIVLVHGGNEHFDLPSPRLVKVCRWLAECGADAVVCHHTHTASGLEVYDGRPIVYGTGNFLFDHPSARNEEWTQGFMVSVTASPSGLSGLRVIPYSQCEDSATVEPLTAGRREAFLSKIADLSSTISDGVILESAWREFCHMKRLEYVGAVLSLNPVERRLLRSGVWPVWRRSRRGLVHTLNLVRCPSHRDVVETVLSGEIASAGGSTSGLWQVLTNRHWVISGWSAFRQRLRDVAQR